MLLLLVNHLLTTSGRIGVQDMTGGTPASPFYIYTRKNRKTRAATIVTAALQTGPNWRYVVVAAALGGGWRKRTNRRSPFIFLRRYIYWKNAEGKLRRGQSSDDIIIWPLSV